MHDADLSGKILRLWMNKRLFIVSPPVQKANIPAFGKLEQNGNPSTIPHRDRGMQAPNQ
jgi:hypothetical protein